MWIWRLFQMPPTVAKQAVENDAPILGVSSLVARHKTIVPQVIAELKQYVRKDSMVIVGGVIPKQDFRYLFEASAAAVFGLGATMGATAIQILDVLIDRFEE
jgi:methylmalonyl-CoA mutase